MSTEHTPGPWKVGKIEPWMKSIEIDGPAVKVDYDDVIREQQEANARLIAAAPDLLLVLKAILGIDNPPAGEQGHVEYWDAVRQGKEIIENL